MSQTFLPSLPELFPAGSVVLFTGDSITHGGRGGDMNHYLGHGYAAEIAMRYLGYMPDRGLQFANRGVSGDTSGRLVARWREDAFPFTPCETGYGSAFPESANHPLVPDFLSILVGVNDLLGDRRTTPGEYERNLRFMVEDARRAKPSVTIILCEPFRMPLLPGDKIIGRQEIVGRLARECGLVHVPFQRLFSDILPRLNRNPGYWFWDTAHPTYAAHIHMADFWIRSVAAALAPRSNGQEGGDGGAVGVGGEARLDARAGV